MGFPEAVQKALRNYATFSGRARRSEYWFFTLFIIIADVITLIGDSALGTDVLRNVATVALFLPSLAVSVRRLHDISRSGWWVLLVFTVVGIVLLIVWACQDSHGPNEHGPSPKGSPLEEPGYPSTV